MASSGNRSPSGAVVNIAFVGAPLILALVIGHLITAGVASNAPVGAMTWTDEIRATYFWVSLGGIAAALGALYVRLRAAGSVTPVAETFIERLAQDDYTGAMQQAREGLHVSPQAEQALGRLQDRGAQLKVLARGTRGTLESMGSSVITLSESLTMQLSAAQDVARVITDNVSFHRGISDSVDGLSRSAEATSSSILEMVAINNEVTENIHNLALSVQETTTAIEEMTFSVKEVAKNIEELSTAAEETAASMNEMDVSISQVETNANETAKLSETVTGDAETGVSAINKTIQGIDKIKESSRIAAEVIGNLGQKIDEIGNILTVIDDVAEQTNLLALNAAIIAAQAGEHGRGFAVVADEIKALAERTGSSTKEIAELIKAVQDESRNAISVMSQGVEDVEEGVRLGHNAEDALRKIVESAKRSTLMIKAIAQATVEQSKGSKQVTNAISRIAETVQQIALATAEQAKGSEQIMKSAERMKVITQQVERSTEEQNRGGRQMTEAIENIREMVEQINNAQTQQIRGNERTAAAGSQVRNASERSLELCRSLERLIGEAQRHLDSLDRLHGA